VHVRCEHDDGSIVAEVDLPAVLSCAERLCDPAKVDPAERARVDPARIRRVRADDLGPGPYGQEGSPTWVGPVRLHEGERLGERWPDRSLDEQVRAAVRVLVERGALDDSAERAPAPPVPPPARAHDGARGAVAVAVEPERATLTRELLGAAASLATVIGAPVVALTAPFADAATLGSWGADEVVVLDGAEVEEDVAHGVVAWARAEARAPWAILAPSTAWGREVAARAAIRLDAGLTGDAVALEVDVDDRLVAWKPAFGGRLVAAIAATSETQMATVRAGVLDTLTPRAHVARVRTLAVTPTSRTCVLLRTRDDDLDLLAEARVVVGVGRGVDPADYGALDPLRRALGAELGATRKVTDEGWLPRSRQVGITGRSIAPRLYVSIGASGKFNHVVGVRAAGTVLAINPDPSAPVFDAADVGIVGSWRDAVPRLVEALARATTPAPPGDART
jgi:electron transfer flavoprotein alpha subunit